MKHASVVALFIVCFILALLVSEKKKRWDLGYEMGYIFF